MGPLRRKSARKVFTSSTKVRTSRMSPRLKPACGACVGGRWCCKDERAGVGRADAQLPHPQPLPWHTPRHDKVHTLSYLSPRQLVRTRLGLLEEALPGGAQHLVGLVFGVCV